MNRAIASLGLTLSLFACQATAKFECADNTQCGVDSNQVPGICESTNFCSFVDGECPTGRRYDSMAGSGLGSECRICPDRASLAVGQGSVCFTTTGVGTSCIGSNDSGQLTSALNSPDQLEVAPVEAMKDASKISLGFHTCVIIGGELSCFGPNDSGQLGNASAAAVGAPVLPVGLGLVKDVAVGGNHTCAIESTGALWCWGRGFSGQLGNGQSDPSGSGVPVRVLDSDQAKIDDATQVVAGDNFNCALRPSGVICWGNNTSGQVGVDDSADSHYFAKEVVGLAGTVTQLEAGSNHVCALGQQGTVECWGDNSLKQTVPTSVADSLASPQLLPLPSAASALALGEDFSCALLETGLACWGNNDFGQTGEGTTTVGIKSTDNLGDVVLIAGGGKNLCVTTTDAIVQCVGENMHGQLALATDSQQHSAPGVLATCR
jgi:alpha-tubulin suppressor-like RCC1 family protein